MTGYGFDRGRLAYGLRTAGAAAIALWLAWGLGLEHPQWAAMTVWAASQPVRAHLIDKSLFRGLGTLVGAVFGVLLAALAARTGGRRSSSPASRSGSASAPAPEICFVASRATACSSPATPR
jgi:hypothetical protein